MEMKLSRFEGRFIIKRIKQEEVQHSSSFLCEHHCQSFFQFVSCVSGKAEFELCLREVRRLGSMMLEETIKVDHERYIQMMQYQEQEDQTADIGDIFNVVLENSQVTPYLISYINGQFILIHMHSGQINYFGNTIEMLIENFFHAKQRFPSPNPITHYYFVKSYENKISQNKIFGLKKIE